MHELAGICGLNIALNEAGKLVFGAGLAGVEPAVRLKEDMREVLLHPAAPGPKELYDMYRNIHRPVDKESIKARGLRYDMTVIKPGLIGGEYIKTAGHYHPEKQNSGVTYPEIYEVVHGTAYYLLQELVPGEKEVSRAVFLAAEAGDRVLIPPNFGHITINPGREYLVMANWVAAGFSSDYTPFQARGGGAYFLIPHGDSDTEFIPNRRYKPLPSLETWQPVEAPELNIYRGRSFYEAFFLNPEGFNYLTEPEKYGDMIAAYIDRAAASLEA